MFDLSKIAVYISFKNHFTKTFPSAEEVFPVQIYYLGKFPKSSGCKYEQFYGTCTKQQAVSESICININKIQFTCFALTKILREN